MMPTDGVVHIPATYGEFMQDFIKDKAETLLPHWSTDHGIDLEPSSRLLYWLIYNLWHFELRMLNNNIEANLANRFIQRSLSLAAAPILIAKKKYIGLRLCVEYRALNLVTVKDQYTITLISEMLDCVREAKIFTKLTLRGAYNLIRIKEAVEYKTAV
jgi:hypothetical protein